MMANGYQNAQGFGAQSVQAELQRRLAEEQQSQDQVQLAAKLAGLPDTELGYDWLGAEMPKGEMVSGRYVAPSWTQQVASATKQGLGGMMINRRNQAAKQVAFEFEEMMRRRRQGQMGAPGAMTPDPRHEIDSLNGQ